MMRTSALVSVIMVTACTMPNEDPAFASPEASGLISIRAYPGANDVCRVIGESAATVDYLDHTATLVGCPSRETGALSDRIAEGGTQLEQIGDWVLVSVPN